MQRLVARTEEMVVEELEDGIVVYDGRAAEAHWLEAGAAAVWRACQEPRSEREIALVAGIDAEQCELVLCRLMELGLVDAEPGACLTSEGGRYSRRVVLRTAAKVGVAGAVAVPIVSTFVPSAAAASSTPIPLCLYTPEYWKHHPPVLVRYLPQSLGSFPVSSVQIAELVFENMNFSPKNAVNTLAGYLLAAELNVALNRAAGRAIPACAINAIGAATSFLSSIPYTGVHSYPPSWAAQASALHVPLDKFNNGSLTC